MNGRLDTLQAVLLADVVTTPQRVPDSVTAWAIYAILVADKATRARL